MEVQWSLVLFAAFIALGSGAYIGSTVFSEWLGLARRTRVPAMVLSAVAIVIGAIASMTHLGHLDRIFGVLSNPSSGIFVEGLSSALLVVVIAVYLVALRRGASPRTTKAIATIGLVPAAAVNVALGMSYAMAARPAWDVVALPVLSVTTALFAGCVAILALNALAGMANADDASEPADADVVLKKAVLVMAVVQAAVVVAFVALVGGAPYQDASRSVSRMLTGDLAFLFWGGVVACGIAAPIALALAARPGSQDGKAAVPTPAEAGSVEVALPQARTRSGAALPLVALVCVFLAVVAFRVVMFSLGSGIVDFGF